MEVAVPQKSPVKGGRILWIVGFLAIIICGGLLVKNRLDHYSSFEDFDPSPIPRPTKNAPFIVTPDKIVDKMIEVANITDKDMVYDLGCGDGRLVITAAVKSGCRGIGFDIDPVRVKEATENAKLHDVEKRVEIRQGDVFKVDLREADVVLMYLLPQMLRDLIPQFNECKPGTRLVSHDFKIEGMQEDRTEKVELPHSNNHYVHYYVTPLKKLPPPKQRKYIIE